jgi:hypothetical protein
VDSLVQDSDSDLWRSGRFLLNTGRQLASHKDGVWISAGFPMPPLFWTVCQLHLSSSNLALSHGTVHVAKK